MQRKVASPANLEGVAPRRGKRTPHAIKNAVNYEEDMLFSAGSHRKRRFPEGGFTAASARSALDAGTFVVSPPDAH